MAGIGEAASIIAIIQISSRVFSWCQDYVLSVKDARKDAQRLSAEMVALTDVLGNIDRLGSVKLPNVDLLIKPGGQLDQCKAHLNELAAKLDPGDGKDTMRRAGFRALKWPLNSKEVEKYVSIVERHKKMLCLALAADQTTVTLDTSQGISQLNEDKIIKWLSSTDVSINHFSAQEKHEPMTGNWLMGSSEFECWKTAPNSLLWLHGKELSSTIIEHIKTHCTQSAGSAVAFFYFDFNDTGKQSVRSLISSLIAQLCCQAPNIPDTLKDLYRTCQEGNQSPTMNALKATLSAILSEFREGIYLILDALDECPAVSGERERLLTAIREIHNWSNKSIHLLATSRMDVDIEHAMIPLLTETPICIDSALVDEDIKLYVNNKLTAARFSKWPSKIKQEVESELTAKASGMFRWVVCQLDILQGSLQPSKIRNALKSLPKTLDGTYDRMLLNIPGDCRDQALVALKWLAFSARPLLITELAEAVVVNPREDPPFDSEDRLFAPTEILHLLPGLVSVSRPERSEGDNGEIRLAHFSVKEYLVSQRICDGPASIYSIADMSANLSISETCLSYLLQVGSSDLPSDHLVKEFPLLKYAADYWPHHTRMADQSSVASLDRLNIELLGSRTLCFTNWIRISDPDRWRWGYVYYAKEADDIASPLYYVSGLGLVQLVRLLLDRGADANAQGGLYGNALLAASIRGWEEVVQLLLDRDADVNAQHGDYGNALYVATEMGHGRIVQLLLENGADVNAQGGRLGSALQTASLCGHDQIVQRLLQKGADVNVQGGLHGNALQAASLRGHDQIVQRLLQKGADVNVQGGLHGNALQAASLRGHDQIVRRLLQKGADVNARGGLFGNALQAASVGGYDQIVQLLLEQKADVNAQGGDFNNALQAASFHGHDQIVKRLLEKEADVNSQGGDYGNTLQTASFHGHEQIVQLLLEKGADINAQGGRFGNALQAASCSGHHQIVQLLLEKGADVDAQGGQFGNALQAASYNGQDQIAQLLLEKGADVTTAPDLGGPPQMPRQILSAASALQAHNLLIENGVNPNQLTVSEFNSLILQDPWTKQKSIQAFIRSYAQYPL